MRERRPLVYDATHLVSRLSGRTATGIDWVDRAYARYLSQDARLACGLHYGLRAPHVLDPRFVAELSRRHRRKFDGDDGREWSDLRNWLANSETAQGEGRRRRSPGSSFAELGATLRARLRDDRLAIPKGAIYLNIAQHGFEYPHFFSWLDQRPDVTPVFLVHDLLPLDYPEFFRNNYETVFRARFETVLRRAGAIIATTPRTAERIAREFRARSRPVPPLHPEPLASPLEEDAIGDLRDARLADSPFFVAIATIEPRKNHILLLNLWRELARLEPRPPKLVLVGGRGLGSAEILDGLARSKTLSRHVRQVSGLSSGALRRLLVNARALLAPSFAEGYGIPLVEALQLETPVVCSDIAVFREVTQGCARFVSPLDGSGWRGAISGLAARNSEARAEALATTAKFRSPSWGEYFAHVEEFLSGL
jgi:glycosyltransferase involved in cell wall biosynthesis